ncbi:MAG: hypothetical protein GXZ03_02450 [Proteiniphilum sp.]|nr:hypothetical protein [Proteiniphilum sp.]
MIKTILVAIAVLAIGIMLMGVRIFFTKKGRFPSLHISDSQPMKDRGVTCATSQDKEALKRESIVKKLLAEEL